MLSTDENRKRESTRERTSASHPLSVQLLSAESRARSHKRARVRTTIARRGKNKARSIRKQTCVRCRVLAGPSALPLSLPGQLRIRRRARLSARVALPARLGRESKYPANKSPPRERRTALECTRAWRACARARRKRKTQLPAEWGFSRKFPRILGGHNAAWTDARTQRCVVCRFSVT